MHTFVRFVSIRVIYTISRENYRAQKEKRAHTQSEREEIEKLSATISRRKIATAAFVGLVINVIEVSRILKSSHESHIIYFSDIGGGKRAINSGRDVRNNGSAFPMPSRRPQSTVRNFPKA